MFGFGKKRQEQEAQAQMAALAAAAEQRHKEMESLAANPDPEVAKKAAQARALAAAQVAEERQQEALRQEIGQKVEEWISINKEEAAKIREALILAAFESTNLPKDNLPIFRFYCVTPFLHAGPERRIPGVVYLDNGLGAKDLYDLFYERARAARPEINIGKGELSLVQRFATERQNEWAGINMHEIRKEINGQTYRQIVHLLPT